MVGSAQMSLPLAGAQMTSQPGMMGPPGIHSGMMGPGVTPSMQMHMMPGSIPSAPLPVSTVPGAMQPGMIPAHGMVGMPASSVGMTLPGNQVRGCKIDIGF